ncbi:MAG TPA: DUF255 domain-containing protein [Pirellulales bacterium]|nr:DUF255 domain-containing protein [Pirellulales bacterium]
MNRLLEFGAVGLYRGFVVQAIVAASITWLAYSGVHRRENLCLGAEPKTVEKSGFTNHLIIETSPYLLQHAHNPVQWYPWGQEAFDRAKKENKLIFLSIGYSTCYWCHVMERESFEDERVAKQLNDNFIAIKVDREERPELDEQYMLANELMTGGGGWPNSLWLTPDRKPFLAGNYLPKARFEQVLTHIASTWKQSPDAVKKQAGQLADAVRAASGRNFSLARSLDQTVIDQAVMEAIQAFDSQHGGFGGAPKFPPHGRLLLLVEEYRRTGEKQLLKMITRTLDAMADGGIHDQVGGGFHRYSTDASWFRPHFEKMLYDNAQLMRLYTDAYLLTKDPRYKQVVHDIESWVKREMTDSRGGFYSALDAESEGEEGKFYSWSYSALLQTLGEADGPIFAREYGAQPNGNWVEQRSGKKPGTNILSRNSVRQGGAGDRGDTDAKLDERLSAMRAKLLAVRDQRTRPRLDDKVLAGWNGLMIDSLAYAGRTLDEPEYTATAVTAATFILHEMWKDDRLLHTYRKGQARIPGYLDDYAYLGRGLIELEVATKNDLWGAAAEQISDSMLKQFADPERGAFFFTPSGADGPLLRSKNLLDGSNVPNANGVAAELLLRLATERHRTAYQEVGRQTLTSLAGFAAQRPSSAESILLATAYQISAKSANDDEHTASEVATTLSKPDGESHEPSVAVRLYSSKRAVAPGETFRVIVDLDIKRGWHLYASGSSKSVQPATVELQKSERATAVVARAPTGRALKDQALMEDVWILEGVAEYELNVTIDKDAPDGPVELKFEVQTQACDSRSCLRPHKSFLRLSITVDHKATGHGNDHPEVFDARRQE